MSPSSIPPPSELSLASDRELVEHLRSGQMAPLATLYDRYGRLVYTLALRLLANREEAEDLTQEVFIYLSQRSTYNPDLGSLGSYLATYTRSRALDRLRTRSNRQRILRQFQRLISPSSRVPSPVEAVAEREQAQAVQAALAQLPEAERTILENAYFEGYSQSQIAQRLGLPLGTVKTRARQGLKRLRQILAAPEAPGGSSP